MNKNRLSQAQTAVDRAPHRPHTATTLYLYDKSYETIDLACGAKPHVSVRVDDAHFALAAWSPNTLRRFAETCMAAADQLEDELAHRAEAVAS